MKYYQRGSQSSKQLGIIRTNSLKCLRRTNLVQMKIALMVLKNQCMKHKIDIMAQNFKNNKSINEIAIQFWDENDKTIAIQYDDLEIKSPEVIETSSKIGDNCKNHCIDILLGEQLICKIYYNIDCDENPSESINEMINIQKNGLRLFIGSWNEGGGMPKEDLDLSPWFEACGESSP